MGFRVHRPDLPVRGVERRRMLPRPGSRDIDRKARLAAPPVSSPVRPPETRIRNFDEVFLAWTSEMVVEEASRCLHCPGAPCVRSCPLDIDIPLILRHTEQREFRSAATLLARSNNLPEICARICPQLKTCEAACPHVKYGGTPVALGRIGAFLADRHREEQGWHAERVQPSGHRVAVVGAGAAGLTVAEQLTKNGHVVTVFEQWPDGGGTLRYGMPRFKLDHCLVRKHLTYLRALGVEFVFDTRIGDCHGVNDLFSLGFEAVFLGTGAGLPRRGCIPGEDLKGVHDASSFLVRANVEQNLRPSDLEDPPEVGRSVIVIGGGDQALDCSRTTLRLGGRDVKCVYRRTEEEMPSHVRDRWLAREEGVLFEWLTAPKRILANDDGHVRAVEFLRTRLGHPDSSGRPAPEPIPGSEFELPADTVILALGMKPDPGLVGKTPSLETLDEGWVVADARNGRTTREMVWAGGGNVLGPSPVASAVAQARRAAADIHERLSW